MESAGSLVPALHLLCQVTRGKWPYLSLFPHVKKWPVRCSVRSFSPSFDCCTQTFVSCVLLYPALVTVSKARRPARHGASQAAGRRGCEAACACGSRDCGRHSGGNACGL